MSRISRQNRVTILVRVMREAGLTAGDQLVVRVVGRGRIELERVDDPVKRWAGRLPAGTYPSGYLDELRDKWSR